MPTDWQERKIQLSRDNIKRLSRRLKFSNRRSHQRGVRSVTMPRNGKKQHQCSHRSGRQRSPPPANCPSARNRRIFTRCPAGRSPDVLRSKPRLNPRPEPFRFRFGEIRLTFAYLIQPIFRHNLYNEFISFSFSSFRCLKTLPRLRHIPESFSPESSSPDEIGRPTSPR